MILFIVCSILFLMHATYGMAEIKTPGWMLKREFLAYAQIGCYCFGTVVALISYLPEASFQFFNPWSRWFWAGSLWFFLWRVNWVEARARIENLQRKGE